MKNSHRTNEKNSKLDDGLLSETIETSTTVIEFYKNTKGNLGFLVSGNSHFVTTYYYSVLHSGEKIYIPRNGRRKTATTAHE